MSRKKPIDKAQLRARRNRMLDAAAAAKLSLTEGVREMRAISGMTQEEFARHRGVSARVIKAVELGQANPTMATMNRIGQFFGLEVAFVPIMREAPDGLAAPLADDPAAIPGTSADLSSKAIFDQLLQERQQAAADMHNLSALLAEMENRMNALICRIDGAADATSRLP